MTDKERAILNDIESQYIRYSFAETRSPSCTMAIKKPEGLDLQKKIRGQFFQIIELCRQFKKAMRSGYWRRAEKLVTEPDMVNALAMVALLSVVILGAILGSILIKDVLGPIRRLAMEADFPRSELVRETR